MFKKNIKRERRKIKGSKKIFHGKKPKCTGRHLKLMNFKDRAQIFFRTKILRERIFKIKGTTKYIKVNHRNQNVKPHWPRLDSLNLSSYKSSNWWQKLVQKEKHFQKKWRKHLKKYSLYIWWIFKKKMLQKVEVKKYDISLCKM